MLLRLQSVNFTRWLWRLLTVAAIIFAAGPSGAWLGEQFANPLPYWWGWFGTSLVGVALFGGVNLAIRGDKWGKVVVLIGSIAAMVFDYHYFSAKSHDGLTTITLALFPTLIAILGGIVESRWASNIERVETEIAKEDREEARRQREWEREQAAKESHRAAVLEAKRIELEAKRLDMPIVQPNVQLNAPVQPERSERSKAELLNELLNYLSEHPNATYSQIEKVIGRSKGSISGYVSELTESGHLAKNGNGWEVTR